LALLNNDLRAASITCASATCRCLALSRRTFDRLLGPLEAAGGRGSRDTLVTIWKSIETIGTVNHHE
jgi:hypothetical protein